MQQLVAIDEYIREFDHGDTVKAAELFTPYVSCNLALFGLLRSQELISLVCL